MGVQTRNAGQNQKGSVSENQSKNDCGERHRCPGFFWLSWSRHWHKTKCPFLYDILLGKKTKCITVIVKFWQLVYLHFYWLSWKQETPQICFWALEPGFIHWEHAPNGATCKTPATRLWAWVESGTQWHHQSLWENEGPQSCRFNHDNRFTATLDELMMSRHVSCDQGKQCFLFMIVNEDDNSINHSTTSLGLTLTWSHFTVFDDTVLVKTKTPHMLPWYSAYKLFKASDVM